MIYRGEFGYSEEANRYSINQYTNKEIVDPSGPQPILGNPTADNFYDTELPNFQDYQEDILFQRGTFQSNYLSVTGRTHSTNFLLSMQRLRDEGVIQSTDGYTRNSFRLNLAHQLSEKFDVQVNSMFATSKQDLLPASSGATGSYLANVLALTPIYGLDAPNEEDGSSYDWDIDNTGNGVTNPLYLAENTDQQVNRTRLLGTIGANYYANDWLTFSYAATLDRSTNDYEHFINKGFLSTDIPGLFGNLASANAQNSSGGGIHRTQRVNEYLTSRFDATIRKKLGGINIVLKGSYLYEDQQVIFDESIGENLAVEDIRSLDNAQSNVFIASEKQDIIGHSGFLIADVDYKNKYLFSGLFRREGSSLFGPEKRWHNYYRVSGAYRITEDINLKIFQDLKLRASIGTAGIRPNFTQRFETFNLINGTTTRNTLGNEFLRPATSNEMEIGVNGTLFKAFDLEVNYVKNTTEDQIILVPLSGAAGFSGQWRNAGTLEATVYEASINTDFAKLFKIKNTDFHWDLKVIFDRVEQTITQLDIPAYNTGPGTEQSSLFLIQEGIPFGTMVGEVFATSVEQLADQEFVNPADYAINDAGYIVRADQLGTPDEKPYKLVDANGNPLVQTIGDINPDFRMGFANTIEYKGFRLFALVDWKKGGDVYNQSKQYLYGLERHSDLSAYDISAGFYGNDGLQNGLVANNHFVEDGSFIMLREATLSYTLNKGLFGKLIENMQFSLIGRNLFTTSDYSGFHPDVTSVPRDENTLTNRVPGNRGSEVTTPNGDPSLFYVDAFQLSGKEDFHFPDSGNFLILTFKTGSMKRILRLQSIYILAFLFLASACQDLNTVNNNNPDRGDVLSTGADLVTVLNGGYIAWWRGVHTEYPVIALSVAADAYGLPWDDFGAQRMGVEPRNSYNNRTSEETDYKKVASTPWYGCLSAVSSANDVLMALEEGVTIDNGGPQDEAVMAAAHFLRGISWGYLALIYDQVLLVDENTNLNGELIFTSYDEAIEPAVDELEEAISLATSSDINFIHNYFNGLEFGSATFIELCHSYAARFLVQWPRTPEEQILVDWQAAADHAEGGLSQDFAPEADGKFWESYHKHTFAETGQGPLWARVDQRIIAAMDPSQPARYPEVAAMGEAPLVNTQATSNDARLETDFKYFDNITFPVSRGEWHFSHYQHNRNVTDPSFAGDGSSNGPMPTFLKADNELLLAEAYLNLNRSSDAVSILNNGTRTNRGQLSSLSSGLSNTELNKAIFYERAIELFNTAPLGLWLDRRRSAEREEYLEVTPLGGLQMGTPAQLPVPAEELRIHGLDPYNFGGSQDPEGITPFY